MFYSVNHVMHSLHTIRPGSKFEQAIADRQPAARLVVRIGGEKHSVFRTTQAAKDFQTLLMMDGGQH